MIALCRRFIVMLTFAPGVAVLPEAAKAPFASPSCALSRAASERLLQLRSDWLASSNGARASWNRLTAEDLNEGVRCVTRFLPKFFPAQHKPPPAGNSFDSDTVVVDIAAFIASGETRLKHLPKGSVHFRSQIPTHRRCGMKAAKAGWRKNSNPVVVPASRPTKFHRPFNP